jgi:hypothetical protein
MPIYTVPYIMIFDSNIYFLFYTVHAIFTTVKPLQRNCKNGTIFSKVPSENILYCKSKLKNTI